MKFIFAFILGCSSLESFALPILREGVGEQNIYQDHEIEHAIYYMPTEASILDEKYVALMHSENGKIDSLVILFMLSGKVDYHQAGQDGRVKGKLIAPIPVNAHRFTMAAEMDLLQLPVTSTKPSMDLTCVFKAKTTERGSLELQNRLMNGPVTVAKSCYTVEGVTPVFSGEIRFNPSRVAAMFGVGKVFSENEVKRILESLMRNSSIKIRDSLGDANGSDYLQEVMRIIRLKMFDVSADGSQTVKEMAFHDVAVVFKPRGRRVVKKEFCIDLKVGPLQKIL